jgi:hypothetical protein
MMRAYKTRNRGLNLLHPGTAIPAAFQMSDNFGAALRRKLAIRPANQVFVQDVTPRPVGIVQ